jgi:acetolactate synthase-1/2/3 large subunit
MVRQWQELFYNKRYSHSYLGNIPDYVKLAEAYGATGFRATKPREVLPTLQQAFATPGPVVTEVVIDSEEKVYPMVPAGAALREMVLAKRRGRRLRRYRNDKQSTMRTTTRAYGRT